MTDEPAAARRPGSYSSRVLRLAALSIALVVAAVVVQSQGWDDPGFMRRTAARSGAGGAALFAAVYAALTLTPLPKNALSTTAGVVFGFATGLLVVWSGAVTGALVAFGLARTLGRGGGQLTGGRLQRFDAVLARHGVAGALLVRLIPVLPFTAVNYGSGFTALQLRHYVLGTAFGIVPGSVVYVGLGAGTVLLPGWGAIVIVGLLVLAATAAAVVRRRRSGTEHRVRRVAAASRAGNEGE